MLAFPLPSSQGTGPSILILGKSKAIPSAVIDPVKPEKMSVFSKEISFNKVSFAYENELVIDKLNLTIPKGSSVALVGPSGGGKSTIANLVPRFYDVNEGSISIDGRDILQITKNDLRSLMGIVTQDSILFNDT